MKFRTDSPIDVRLSAVFRTAVGWPTDSDIPLWAASIEDGWLLADYRESNGDIRRYAIPPEHVIYVRQLHTPSSAPPPVRVQ